MNPVDEFSTGIIMVAFSSFLASLKHSSKVLQDIGIESNLRQQNLNTDDLIKIFYPISNFIKKNER